jgi:hypothetical protein
MTTSTLAGAFHSTGSCDDERLSGESVTCLYEPDGKNRAARGAITGILLGAGMWAAIFLAVGAFRH